MAIGHGARVVFTDGVFDMLHANHVAFLEEARSLGDRLVVGVVSDARTLEYKRLPIMTETERLRVVLALGCVDDAFIIHDPLVAETMEAIISRFGVGAVVYAGDSTPGFYVPAERAGIMFRLPYRGGICSSEIIGRIVTRHRAGEFTG
jgi:cytidyltransferase-like protein